MMEQEIEKKPQEFHLPIELKTVLKAVKLKFLWLVALAILSVGIGAAAALFFGTQNYRTATVLMYQPIESFVTDTFRIYQGMGEGTDLSYEHGAGLVKTDSRSKSLYSQVSLVKTLPNLERLRQELELNRSLSQVGSSIDVDYSNDSNLMLISGKSESAVGSMLIANTMRDIFLESSNRMVAQDLETRMRNLQMQYDAATTALEAAQKEFREFSANFNIRDIGVENQKAVNEIMNLELSLPKSKQQIETLRLQIEKINLAISTATDTEEEYRRQQEAEAQALALELEALAAAEQAAEQAALAQKQQAAEASAADPAAASTSPSAPSAPSASTGDSLQPAISRTSQIGQITEYQSEYSALSDYIKLTTIKLLEKELDLIAVESAYSINKEQYAHLVEKYKDLPEISQKYTSLAGLLASLEAETRGLEKVLSQFEIITRTEYSDFFIVSDAEIPLFPQASNRKLIAAAGAVVSFLIGFSFLLLGIVLDTRLKSTGDAVQKLQKRVLGEFPFERSARKLLPVGQAESSQIERYRILARPLRKAFTDRNVVFLMTSAAAGEGKSTTAINLAAVYGRQDERVLLIDAQIRRTQEDSLLRTLLIPPGEGELDKPLKGLGEYLSYQVFDYDEIITQTQLPGVDMIVGLDVAVIPDLLQSARMQELMDALKEQYTVIIIEGPPVAESVDTEILSYYSDTIILVSACGMLNPEKIRRAIKRLENAECPMEGLILTKVLPAFLT
jgi:capsular exopolysaccharide synthesis family protein